MSLPSTDLARKVMQLANQAAQRRGREYIGTEHVLWALLMGRSCVAAKILENVGMDIATILGKVERLLREGDQSQGNAQVLCTKKAIEWAMQEAQQFNHDYIGTEHILLGLMHEPGETAAQLLMSDGLTLGAVREALTRLLDLGIRAKPMPRV